jgi:2-polyprenyl-3-methyl-5-hydroxy-6-metoxy-1,4-benzoquinol methylase
MPSFKLRSYQKELLDNPDIPFDDIRRNMEELDFINRYLGGHKISINGLEKLLKNQNQHKGPVKIVELGCGGGDNLRALSNWARKEKIEVELTGIDISEACIAFARSIEKNKGIRFINSDYKLAGFETKPDILFSSLFCHHFTDQELIFMMRWMQQNARIGFFINDLHRHPIAYHLIRILTRIFSKSYLVKNDAPVSVLRGFTRNDWDAIFEKAQISNFSCEWKWAFRWLVTCPGS